MNKVKSLNNSSTKTSFIVVTVGEGQGYLKPLVAEIDYSLSVHNFEKFYEKPVFHVSLLATSS